MKKITTQEIRDLLNQVYHEEISFSRMVEILNEMVSEAEKKCVEDIPKRKFQKGDRVRIKEGVSSKTHYYFPKPMDYFIGTTMTVYRYTHHEAGCYVLCDESGFVFREEWLEPYVEELKKGDLAIFWDSDKSCAYVEKYNGLLGNGSFFPHQDHRGNRWVNAIKFESKEQYERFINGEI